MLLFRLSALFLLWFAERVSPVCCSRSRRATQAGRLTARSPAKDDTGEDVGAQTPSVGVHRVPDSALQGGLDVVQVDQPRRVGAGESAHAATEAMSVVVAQAPLVGKYQVVEQAQPLGGRADVGLARVQPAGGRPPAAPGRPPALLPGVPYRRPRRPVKSPGGVSPPGAHRTVREPLGSYGSYRPAAARCSRRQ